MINDKKDTQQQTNKKKRNKSYGVRIHRGGSSDDGLIICSYSEFSLLPPLTSKLNGEENHRRPKFRE